mmetsp:Transcript_12984/g.15759  ORF Transcript_12984/g.15759 Transcript_12984/m.15759 type:complete len:331 (+) Transcript_12984:134-1126(+)
MILTLRRSVSVRGLSTAAFQPARQHRYNLSLYRTYLSGHHKRSFSLFAVRGTSNNFLETPKTHITNTTRCLRPTESSFLLYPLLPGNVRFMHAESRGTESVSSTTNEVDDDKTDDDIVPQVELHPLEKAKIFAAQYGGYIGISAFLTYAFYRTVHYTTTSLLSINFWDMGKYSFVVGILGGVSGTLLVTRVIQSLGIRPEHVRKAALRKVVNSPDVQRIMGASITNPLNGGLMRAYSKDGGHFAIDKTSRSIVWKKPRIKMLFQIYGGADQQAIVCVEAVKTQTKLDFDLISVDRITGEAVDPVIVAGTEQRYQVRGQLTDLVHLKKKYI